MATAPEMAAEAPAVTFDLGMLKKLYQEARDSTDTARRGLNHPIWRGHAGRRGLYRGRADAAHRRPLLCT